MPSLPKFRHRTFEFVVFSLLTPLLINSGGCSRAQDNSTGTPSGSANGTSPMNGLTVSTSQVANDSTASSLGASSPPGNDNGSGSTGDANPAAAMGVSGETADPAAAANGSMDPGAEAQSGEQESQSGPPPRIPLGPTPASATSNFPFPQNRTLPNCVRPSSFTNDDVMAAYEQWYTNNVTGDGAGGALRIQRSEEPTLEPKSTVSEGIAYGMLIAVYMDDQQLFDQLWRYEQQWLDENGLMHWYINAAGTEPLGVGAASDAEEDMAWALLMAEQQWGGQGSLDDSYGNIARHMIQTIWEKEILDGRYLLPGDGWGDIYTLNVSYFTPSYYRAFAEATGNSGWNDVAAGSYDALEASLNDQSGNATNGLVPAWSGADGNPNPGAWGPDGNAPTHHQYDSCRTPFRIGLDYCFTGEPRSRAYLEKITGFYAGIGAAGIHDGYDLNGTPHPQYSDGPNEYCDTDICQSAAFLGPAAVGAMYDTEHQPFLDEAYELVKTSQLLVGGRYYDESWTVISLLMMTGNFLDYRMIEPVVP